MHFEQHISAGLIADLTKDPITDVYEMGSVLAAHRFPKAPRPLVIPTLHYHLEDH